MVVTIGLCGMYTLTTGVDGIIVANANDIVLDGAGHEISSILLQGTTNVTVF